MTHGIEKTVIAIDPGSVKCGLAVLSSPPLARLASLIVETERLVAEVSRLVRQFPHISAILLGDGTGSAALRRAVAAAFPDLPVEMVDEAHSSERARRRYLEEVPPKRWQKLVPRSLRTPDQPYDNFVAILLAEDYFLKRAGITTTD